MPAARPLVVPAPFITAGVAAALAGLCLALRGVGAHGVITAFAIVVLVVIAAVDIDQRVVPNKIVLPTTAIVLSAQIASQPDRAAEWLLASLGAAALLLVLAVVNPRGMGMGDVKLALLIGATLGEHVVIAFFLASVAVLPVACWILLRRGAAARTETIAFAPFLAFGAIAAALFV